jgi:hypothetical protein
MSLQMLELRYHLTSIPMQRDARCYGTILQVWLLNRSAAVIKTYRCFDLILEPILYRNPAC